MLYNCQSVFVSITAYNTIKTLFFLMKSSCYGLDENNTCIAAGCTLVIFACVLHACKMAALATNLKSTQCLFCLAWVGVSCAPGGVADDLEVVHVTSSRLAAAAHDQVNTSLFYSLGPGAKLCPSIDLSFDDCQQTLFCACVSVNLRSDLSSLPFWTGRFSHL